MYADKKAEIHHVKENFPVAQVTLYALAIVFGVRNPKSIKINQKYIFLIAIIIFIGILIITRIKTKVRLFIEKNIKYQNKLQREEAEELPEGTPVVNNQYFLNIYLV